MGMGYAANYADVIDKEMVEAICPLEYKVLMLTLNLRDSTLEEFALDLYLDDVLNEDIEEAYNDLCLEFNKRSGLNLRLGYHSMEDGDRYDDIDGAFWEVTGMWELSPQGKAVAESVKRKFFVTFG